MKPVPKKRPIIRGALEKRRDWIMFSCYAQMHVSVSGGPIHHPCTPVLQLLLKPWQGDCEAWTVYRHKDSRRQAGKIVFKKWNRAADLERFRALGDQPAPQEWNHDTNVIEQHFPVIGHWVADLEHALDKLSVPPVTGAIRPLRRETEFKLSLWRGRQESVFGWHTIPPPGWRPLGALFHSLHRNFRRYAEGKLLGPLLLT